MKDTKQFREILDHFSNAMLVTQTTEGAIHARPMFIAKSEDSGEMWFVTALESEKVEEILSESHAAVTMQSPTRYLCVSGRATVIRDPERVEALWKPVMYAWFEKDDPNVALIRFVPEEAEYWDEAGMRGIRYAFQAIKAAVTGEKLEPSDVEESHGRVHL